MLSLVPHLHATIAAALPNPSATQNTDLSQSASDAYGLIKSIGQYVAGGTILLGSALVSVGNHGGNHYASISGKGLLFCGVAALVLLKIAIPIVNQVFLS